MGIFQGYPLSRSPSPHYAVLCPRGFCVFWGLCFSPLRASVLQLIPPGVLLESRGLLLLLGQAGTQQLTLLPQFGAYRTDFLDSLYEQL